MPILIQTVRISGFRGLKNIEVPLELKTVIIGANNAGKTSFLKAFQLSMGDSRFLGEDDFHISLDGQRSNLIVIDVRIVPTDNFGKLTTTFDELWSSIFRSDIQIEEDQEFLAIRTKLSQKDDQKRFAPERYFLKIWPKFDGWDDEKYESSNRAQNFAESIPLYFQEPQRDILDDLRERKSYLGRILSKVKYNDDDMTALKEIIDDLNETAISKSEVLSALQSHLCELKDAIGGNGKTEISSVAKDVRDLTKGLRLHYQEGANSFSMEYHGMGTRSWASLLTMKAFAKIVVSERATDNKPFFPILALEEPEAHLHPNAQKHLYTQITDFPGQVVISTHSPYISANADLGELRSFYRSGDQVLVGGIPQDLDIEDKRRIGREVINTRGELFFSKLIILCEGETEEQALPVFFKDYFERFPYELGVNFVGISGCGNYKAFFRFANAIKIPWLVFSDGEVETLKRISHEYESVFHNKIDLFSDFRFVVLPNGAHYEKYLLESGYGNEIEAILDDLNGEGWVSTQINKLNGKLRKSHSTEKICATCKQHIFKGEKRDYSGTDGKKNALADFMLKDKTRLAVPIARAILSLDKARRYPPLVDEIFKKVGIVLSIETSEKES
ncbi:MAG: AAA family ATPase [Candidatus Wallbacteria bacterium]|nr:AAA family ATPase [Candidatus Wallbacteria bacterium]